MEILYHPSPAHFNDAKMARFVLRVRIHYYFFWEWGGHELRVFIRSKIVGEREINKD